MKWLGLTQPVTQHAERKVNVPWMSFVKALRLTSVSAESGFSPSADLSAVWFWPGCSDGVLTSRLPALGNVHHLLPSHALLSACCRGEAVRPNFSATLLSCSQVSLFWDSAAVAVSTQFFLSETREHLEPASASENLTVSVCVSRPFCNLRASSEPSASRPMGDMKADVLTCEFCLLSVWYIRSLLFFCNWVFNLRQGLEPALSPQTFLLLLNITKRHFSLCFLHVQNCNLQYKRLLARLDRWETPLTDDLNPLLLFSFFSFFQCVCCIWQRLNTLNNRDLHESVQLWESFCRKDLCLWVTHSKVFQFAADRLWQSRPWRAVPEFPWCFRRAPVASMRGEVDQRIWINYNTTRLNSSSACLSFL